MKILEINKDEVYHIYVNKNIFYRSNTSKTLPLSELIGNKKIKPITSKYTSHPYGLSSDMDGMAIGSLKDLHKELSAKKIVPSTSFKKLYFDTDCKFPRFKLSETTSIKRCLDPAKADSCIINIPEFEEYRDGYRTAVNPEVVRIYKSKTCDLYYIMNKNVNKPEFTYGTPVLNQYLTLISKYSGNDVYEQLLSCFGVDYKEVDLIYEGLVMLLDNKETKLIKRLNDYMQITYDIELDQFIGNNLQKIDKDSITQLNKMFQSSDATIIGMGMKLLSNYNILDNACAIGSLIIDNYRTLQTNSVFNSVGFKQVLKSLDIDPRSFNSSNVAENIGKIYVKSTNPEDRALGREVIRQRMENDIRTQVDRFVNQYKDMDIKVTFEVK